MFIGPNVLANLEIFPASEYFLFYSIGKTYNARQQGANYPPSGHLRNIYTLMVYGLPIFDSNYNYFRNDSYHY